LRKSAGGVFVSSAHVVKFQFPVRESLTPSSEGSSGISTPPDHAKNRRGALFFERLFAKFFNVNLGELTSVPKNVTPLAFVISLAGGRLFSSL